jgi:hypothetical protein
MFENHTTAIVWGLKATQQLLYEVWKPHNSNFCDLKTSQQLSIEVQKPYNSFLTICKFTSPMTIIKYLTICKTCTTKTMNERRKYRKNISLAIHNESIRHIETHDHKILKLSEKLWVIFKEELITYLQAQFIYK